MKNVFKGHALLWVFALLAVTVGAAYGQAGGSFNLTWSTVDGGGVTSSTGGSYTLGGTIGQWDAGKQTGGAYTLDSGFWGPEVTTPSPTATSTSVSTATSTSIPTSTATSIPQSTATTASTATNTPVTPVSTATHNPSATATQTAVGATTNTPVPTSTATRTVTHIPATATTPPGSTATNTRVATSTPHASATATARASGTVANSTATSVAATATASATAEASVLPTSEVCTVSFSDVPADSTFYAYIRCLACRGILGGYSDGTFRPGNDVTRGQLAKIVANAAGFNETVSGQTFSDVTPDSTFYVYIERMAGRGIINGYNDGTFRPGNNATRGQISKIVSNAAGFDDAVTNQTFSDVEPGSTFYEFIERLSSRGIINGYNDGTFRPGNNATRGQTAKIVSNTFFPNCQAR